MKAYIVIQFPNDKGLFLADVIDEDDYDNRGPHAKSYRSSPRDNETSAYREARQWAEKWKYEIVDGPEHF